MIDYFQLLLVGLVVGFVGTFFGIGGGIIIVPFFILLYNLPPGSAVGTSLAIIFLSSLIGIILQLKLKKINFRIGTYLAIASIPGVFLGTLFINSISVVILKSVIGIILIFISIFMFFKENQKNKTEKNNLTISIFSSFIIGFISTIAGIGGGVFQVPQMYYFLNFPISSAISTSQFIILITSLTATVGSFYNHFIKLELILPIFFGSIFGNYFALKYTSKTNNQTLKILFAILLIVVSILILIK